MAEVNSTLIRPLLTEGFDVALEDYLSSFDAMASSLRPGLVSVAGLITAELLLILVIHALGTWNLPASAALLKMLEGYDLTSKVPPYQGEDFALKFGVEKNLLEEAARFAVHLKAFHLAPVSEPLLVYLMRLHTKNDTDAEKELWRSVLRDDYKKVVDAGMKGADLDGKDELGRTPLQVAASHGLEDAALALVSLGAALEARSAPRNATALHYAAEEGRGRLVKVLLRAGASPRVADVRGATPLHLAAAAGDVEAVRALLEAGAEPSALDVFGESALHLAAHSGHKDVVEAIQAAGAQPAVKDVVGKTPLARAANHTDIEEFLKKFSTS